MHGASSRVVSSAAQAIGLALAGCFTRQVSLMFLRGFFENDSLCWLHHSPAVLAPATCHRQLQATIKLITTTHTHTYMSRVAQSCSPARASWLSAAAVGLGRQCVPAAVTWLAGRKLVSSSNSSLVPVWGPADTRNISRKLALFCDWQEACGVTVPAV